MTDNVEKGDFAAKAPKPIIKSEKTEIPLNRQEESGELESLFDNIGALSRERQEQEQGVLQTISGLDPVKYAEIKISGAYSRGRSAGSRNARHAEEVPEIYTIPDEVIERTMGNPGEIRKSQENTEYEEAVYSLVNFGDRLVVVLENEIITEIYTEFELK